jgi:hypothetical protein
MSDVGCERDYTVCTVFEIGEYRTADIFLDRGSQHFNEDGDPGSGPSLARQLLAFLEHWGVSHLVGDATGVGEGLLNWLEGALGPDIVTPFKFTQKSKAQLGVDFLALVETNRFKYFECEYEYDDAWWFFEQAKHCVFELAAGRPMERHMRWFVPETAKVSTPWGSVAVHDDRLISAALIAEADKLVRERKVVVGRAESVVIRGVDPIEELEGW